MLHAHHHHIVWQPDEQALQASNSALFITWLKRYEDRDFSNYRSLWQWSVENPAEFWLATWKYYGLESETPIKTVMSADPMPRTRWFEGATLNFAERLLSGNPSRTAIVYGSEAGDVSEVTLGDLRRRVASVQSGLIDLGVEEGDRVVALLPNSIEAIVAFLAVSGLGAIWSSCSPDFGPAAVIDRFGQLEPKVLVAADGYRYDGRFFDRAETVAAIARAIPSLEHVVRVPHRVRHSAIKAESEWLEWSEAFGDRGLAEPSFKRLPFEAPLWVVYTSGTTGMPKGLVHSHGGILLESLVQSGLHLDQTPEDRFFWFSTTGWVMWNIVVGALSVGAAAVLYDGNPAFDGGAAIWRFAERSALTFFGTSAAFIQAQMKSTQMSPRRTYDFSKIRQVGCTGSPLSPQGFQWIEDAIKPGVFIANISGGTDVCGALAASSHLLPVYAGELQCPALGVKLEVFDELGRPINTGVGELVVTQPMPSMPIRLWNDPDFSRYTASYYETYPGVWRHGDRIEITDRGTYVIHGRSDATLNRGGVRMGTSEFYAVLEHKIPGLRDTMVLDVMGSNGRTSLILLVVLDDGLALDARLKQVINDTLRSELSPRHVPDEIVHILAVPRTINGKKMEVPVKRILQGEDPATVATPDAMANPESLGPIIEHAERRNARSVSIDQH